MRNSLKLAAVILFSAVVFSVSPVFGKDNQALSYSTPTVKGIEDTKNSGFDGQCGRMYLWGREVQNEPYNENARLARCAAEKREKQHTPDAGIEKNYQFVPK